MRRLKIKNKLISCSIIILFLLLFSAGSILAAPTISNVSGEISAGKKIVFSGSSFGEKNRPSPILWDDFNSGVTGTSIDSEGIWKKEANLSAVFDASNVRTGTGKSIAMHAIKSKNQFGVAYYHVSQWASSRKKLFGAWMKVDFIDANNGQPLGGQIKVMDMEQGVKHATPPGICENTIWAEDSANDGGVSDRYYAVWYGGPTLKSISSLYSSGIKDNTWQYVLFEYEESNLNTADGNLNIYKSRTDTRAPIEIDSANNKVSYTVPGYVAEYAKLRVIPETGSSGAQEAIVYYDDVYIDDSWARVEIGDSPSYDDCTHREIQIPSSWSNNSISINVNTGSFKSGQTAYLFVVDPEGNPSPGFPITIGDSSAPIQQPENIEPPPELRLSTN